MELKMIDNADRMAVRARPSGWPIMYQHWGKLLFLHWSVPAESLRPLIPDPLVIDTFDGAAWIGITPFHHVGHETSILASDLLFERVSRIERTDVRSPGWGSRYLVFLSGCF
jgi:hypothetical protein